MERNCPLLSRPRTTIAPCDPDCSSGRVSRLSVFTWDGAQWQIAAHANVNPLTG